MKERGGATVLVIDGGGRGSVLVDKYAQSPHVKRILAVPGNDLMGINTDKEVIIFNKPPKPLKTTSISEILEICEREEVSLVDVAQDNAVEAGAVDALKRKGILAIGPTRNAGEIEWNKLFARELGARINLNQPEFVGFKSREEAVIFLNSQPDRDFFVKASGLAEGKGAKGAKNKVEALQKIDELYASFPKAMKTFLLEEWMKNEDGSPGEEFSAFFLLFGSELEFLGNAQDYKKALNFDKGENTGGMGGNSPALVYDSKVHQQAEGIAQKIAVALNEMGRPYIGVMYVGGMKLLQGGKTTVKLVEINSRWGDPEAQLIVPSLQNDLFEMNMNCLVGHANKIERDNKVRVVVTGASKGYPGNYKEVVGKEIYGLASARKTNGVTIYGSGVRVEGRKHYANGGRLFYIVGEGQDVVQARDRACEAMDKVKIEGDNLHFRDDIGWRDVQRLRK